MIEERDLPHPVTRSHYGHGLLFQYGRAQRRWGELSWLARELEHRQRVEAAAAA